MKRWLPTSVAVILAAGTAARGQQRAPATPSEDVEQVTGEAQRTPAAPLSEVDRPVYRLLQESKKELREEYGISWALEDTLIYQNAGGHADPNDAVVNTLGLFATWRIFRDANEKDFAGLGFQAETRSNHVGEFTRMQQDLGTIWSPNDSTSDDYTKINQLWWGQRLAEGRLGFVVGKIDPGAYVNGNRFAGSGNTQFFSQPFATNPARSFPDNGLGFMVRVEPTDMLYAHFTMSDGDAVSSGSPFTTIEGRWFYGGEVGLRPKVDRLGQGNYRLLLYTRDGESADEFGWSFSADQELSADLGVFLRYGGNDGHLNAIEHVVAAGVSFLKPFGRADDQAGVGVSFTRPSDHDLRDEYSTEAFYRLQLTEGIELSGSAQMVVNPSASDENAVAVFGLRLRLLY